MLSLRLLQGRTDFRRIGGLVHSRRRKGIGQMKPFNIDEAFNGVPFCVVDSEGNKHLVRDWGKSYDTIWCDIVGLPSEILFNADGTETYSKQGYKLMLTS
jgi:hypothetical protein